MSTSPGNDCSQASALPGYSWAHQQAEQAQAHEQQNVDDRYCPGTAVEEFFQAAGCGIDEVGKKNGEQEEEQRAARGVDEAQADGEKKSREQHARRAGIKDCQELSVPGLYVTIFLPGPTLRYRPSWSAIYFPKGLTVRQL